MYTNYFELNIKINEGKSDIPLSDTLIIIFINIGKYKLKKFLWKQSIKKYNSKTTNVHIDENQLKITTKIDIVKFIKINSLSITIIICFHIPIYI